jgi:hypothetical protein
LPHSGLSLRGPPGPAPGGISIYRKMSL